MRVHNPVTLFALLSASVLLTGCNNSESAHLGQSTGNNLELPVPATADELQVWLEAGQYRQWTSETEAHLSEGPHFGMVRTWVNPELASGLSDQTADMPVGAAAVKELYGTGDNQPLGWAVCVKIADANAVDNSAGNEWYWYETFRGQVFNDGHGSRQCTVCHKDGQDYVMLDPKNLNL